MTKRAYNLNTLPPTVQITEDLLEGSVYITASYPEFVLELDASIQSLVEQGVSPDKIEVIVEHEEYAQIRFSVQGVRGATPEEVNQQKALRAEAIRAEQARLRARLEALGG